MGWQALDWENPDRHPHHLPESISSEPNHPSEITSSGWSCQGSLHLRLWLYPPSWGHNFQPELMSFSQFHLGSIISSELHSRMFNHTWHSGCSSAWSLRITTALGKAPLHVSTLVHYKLRIITALECLCVHIPSARPIQSIVKNQLSNPTKAQKGWGWTSRVTKGSQRGL